MTDEEKEEIRSIVREELGNVLQETRGGIASDSQLTGRQLIDKLVETISRRAAIKRTPQPSKRI